LTAGKSDEKKWTLTPADEAYIEQKYSWERIPVNLTSEITKALGNE
jgi:hypothetical protein